MVVTGGPRFGTSVGAQIEAVMTTTALPWNEDALVPILRNGVLEQVYWTYGYSPVFDDSGEIGGTLVVCTETTTRKNTQEEIERQRTRLFEFFKQVPAGVCIFRGDGEVRICERTLRTLRRQIAFGRPDTAVGHAGAEGAGVRPAAALRAANRDRGERSRGLGQARPAGGTGAFTDNYYTFNYSPFHDANGAVTGVIALVLDVTDNVLKKQATHELERQLSESQTQLLQRSKWRAAKPSRPTAPKTTF